MDRQLEKIAFTYNMVTAAKLLYEQSWKDLEIRTTEEWWVKMTVFAEVAKLTHLIREKASPLRAFCLKWEKNELVIYGFDG